MENYDFPLKDYYEWRDERYIRKNNEDFITIYSGINKNNKSDFIYVQVFNFDSINLKVDILKQTIKQLIILVSLKNEAYFPNVKFSLSKDHKYLCMYNKEKYIPLNYLINSSKNSYDKKLIKWVIYQISFGLYFLHSNNIIHHDIKTSNILIDEEGGIIINGFESVIFKHEKSFSFSLSYSSPELLINLQANEKSDLWGLGIIMLELFCKKHLILNNDKLNDRNECIKNMLTFFGRNEEYSNEELKKILNGDKNIEFKLKKEILDKIEDKDAIDLINNLLVFNPNKRYTSKMVLESNYLQEYKGIDSLEIKKLEYPLDYEKISKDKIDQKTFIEIIKNIIK